MARVRGRDQKNRVLRQEASLRRRFLGYRGRTALSLPTLLLLAYEWAGRQGAALGTFFMEGKWKQKGGVDPLPSPPTQGTLWGQWLPPGNWESGCMCGHAGQLGPLPPHGQPGELLIRRDSFQSHGMPLIKQTSISRWPEDGRRRPSPGGAHISSRNTEASGSGQNPPSPQWKPSPRQLSSCCTRCWEGEPSLRSPWTRPEPHPSSSLLYPLTSPTSAPDSFK